MNDNVYSSLPFDLSGSRTKNRFRTELLWGIIKFYSLREAKCTIVFDYFCDVEFYFEDRYEFYQVKTDNVNATYTIDRIIKPNKNKESILGKVYILKRNIDSFGTNIRVKSAIVSNIPLSPKKGKKYSNVGEISFDKLDMEIKENIESKLSKELSLESIDFSSIYFVYTKMDLENPNDVFLARTYEYARALLNKEPKNLYGLCALIMQEIQNKACYEFQCQDHEELISKKGITKELLNNKIIEYEDVSNDTIRKLKNIIDNIYQDNFGLCCRVSRALTDIVRRIKIDLNLRIKEKSILNHFKRNIESLDYSYLEIIDNFKDDNIFNIEDSGEDRIVLILYVLTKFKEGYYE